MNRIAKTGSMVALAGVLGLALLALSAMRWTRDRDTLAGPQTPVPVAAARPECGSEEHAMSVGWHSATHRSGVRVVSRAAVSCGEATSPEDRRQDEDRLPAVTDGVGETATGVSRDSDAPEVPNGTMSLADCVQALDGTCAETAAAAVRELARMGSSNGVHALLNAWGTEMGKVIERDLSEAIASVRCPAAFGTLTNVLCQSDDEQLCFAIQRSLAASLGRDEVGALVCAYWRMPDASRRRVADALALSDAQGMDDLLAAVLDVVKPETPEPLCIAMALALARNGSTQAAAILFDAAADNFARGYETDFIADGIAQLATPDALAVCMGAVTGNVIQCASVRAAGLYALVSTRAPEYAAPARSVLAADEDPEFAAAVRARCEQALAEPTTDGGISAERQGP